MDTVIEVYKAVSAFPAEEKYGLKSQVARSAVAIPANIAEGSAKTSEKEYKHFLETAMGSAYELETHLLIVQRLGWLKNEVVEGLLRMIIEVQKMIAAFITKLKPKA